MICKVMEDYGEHLQSNAPILVWYFRQPEGNINKVFIPGLNSQRSKWTDSIERGSILIHNPEFTGRSTASKKILTAKTKRMIPELHHPDLRGWEYTNDLHFVDPDNRVDNNISEGMFVLVLMKHVPSSVKKNLREVAKECPVALGCVYAKSKPIYNGARSVSIGVNWYFSESGNPNHDFIPLVKGRSRYLIYTPLKMCFSLITMLH